MTIFDFRKHKSCLYLPWLAIHSISFTAIRLAQTLQIQGRVDCLILLISAKITSDNTSRPVFADIYSLIFCSKTAPRFIHLIHFNNYFQPEGSEDIYSQNKSYRESTSCRYCQDFSCHPRRQTRHYVYFYWNSTRSTFVFA